jgi:sugar phosphate isomerase/epimerase
MAMKLGVFTVLFQQRPLEETLDYVKAAGCEAVEIGTGAYPGNAHCDVDRLLEDEAARNRFKSAVESRGMIVSALSCHGNPLHPNPDIANQHLAAFEKTLRLAPMLGVDRVINFSGCPGGGPDDKTPNWVTCPWPPDFTDILKWQWEEKVIPFWKEWAAKAKSYGVNKICFEMHPGFVVYNPESLLKLRDAVGEIIGANLDPSHLWWQGMDPVYAIRKLGDAIYHVHAKDTRIDEINTKYNGVLDVKPYADEINRSWIFRTVGYGHDLDTWKAIVSNLRLVGYDYVLSIEHEDSLMSVNEGFTKAVNFLKECIMTEQPGAMWWA